MFRIFQLGAILVCLTSTFAAAQDSNPMKPQQPAAEQQPAAKKTPLPGGVTGEELGVLLEKLGMKAERSGDAKTGWVYSLPIQRGGWDYNVRAAVSPNGKFVTLTTQLFDLPPSDEVRADILEKLLRKNLENGPTHFVLAPVRRLWIVHHLSNQDVTTGKLRREIDALATVVGETRSLWSPKHYPPIETK